MCKNSKKMSSTAFSAKLSSPLIYCSVAIALIFAIWGKSNFQGYFNTDDFEILSVARECSLFEQFFIPHGDHPFPLYRLKIALLKSLFGVDPFFYNGFAFLVLVGIALTARQVLQMLFQDPLIPYAFLLVFFGWLQLGGIINGYYVHNTYLLIILFGNISLWAYHNWIVTRTRSSLILGSFGVLCSLGMGMAGAILLPVVLCWVVYLEVRQNKCRFNWREWLLQHRAFFMAFLGIVSLYALYLVLVFLVFHKGTFLQMRTERDQNVVFQLVFDVFNNLARGHVGGLPGFNFLDMAIAEKRPLVYGLVTYPVLAFLIGFCIWKSDFKDKVSLFFILIIILGSIIFSALGRPGSFASKHISFSYYFFAFLIAFVMVKYLRMIPDKRIFIVLCVGITVIFSSQPLIYKFLRGGTHRDQTNREVKLAITELRATFQPVSNLFSNGGSIPTLDGNILSQRYPLLYKYGPFTLSGFP
jgi:hypothetical protein